MIQKQTIVASSAKQKKRQIHVFVNCQKRKKTSLWLRKELKKLGVHTKLHQAIRGDFGTSKNNKQAMLLVSVTVDLIWRDRGGRADYNNL